MRRFTLLGPDRQPFASARRGTLGGHRGTRIYGRLDCPGALRAIARGGYVANRVFFTDEPTAVAAGFRPCHTCLPAEHRRWKERRAAMPLTHTTVATPIGELLLVADEEAGGLTAI